MSERLPRDFYYLSVAEAVARRSTCINKHWGAVIVKNDSIISTGYNGAPRGVVNCCDLGRCPRLADAVKRGTDYGKCISVHAEANAIIYASRELMLHSTLYLYGYDVTKHEVVRNPNSCYMCKRLIINAGIDTICVADPEAGIPFALRSIPYNARFIDIANWIVDDACLHDDSGY